MGKKDIRLKVYFSDSERYADLWNGGVFCGKQVLKARELEPASSVLDKTDRGRADEVVRDLVMKQSKDGKRFVVWAVENQEYIDYSMPARILYQEALAYKEQVRERKRKNRKAHKGVRGGEYLYGFKKEDKIYPVITLVAYWGEEAWDGPKSLHDMMDWGADEMRAELKALVPRYPIHFLDLSKVEHPEYFKTELRPFLELYGHRNDKAAFIDYVKNSEEIKKMDTESWELLGEVTHASDLVHKLRDKADEEEDEGMCRALEEFYNDGIAEGKAIGITEGIMGLLGELGDVPEKLCRKISGQKDPELLGKWLKIAARVESIGDFEQMIREV